MEKPFSTLLLRAFAPSREIHFLFFLTRSREDAKGL
jgi:hypothetical protein